MVLFLNAGELVEDVVHLFIAGPVDVGMEADAGAIAAPAAVGVTKGRHTLPRKVDELCGKVVALCFMLFDQIRDTMSYALESCKFL